MDREIKFRARHPLIKRMFRFNDAIAYQPSTSNFFEWHNEHKWILMQFTGLKDKNGKDIYELDIVECSYGVGKVIFTAGCFMVEWISDKEADMEFLFSRNGRKQRVGIDEFTVIGNEFQNPELL